MSGSRATSFDISHGHPAVSRTTTSSTTESNQVSRLDVLRTIPLSSGHTRKIKTWHGESAKSNKMRRSASSGSSGRKSKSEFQYYGRHGNSWLFNDWSVKESVKKGWTKVFSKNDTDEE